MPQIPCSWCDFNHRIIDQTTRPSAGSTFDKILDKDELLSVLTCGACGKKSLFRLSNGYALTFLPGKIITEDLRNDVAPNAADMFQEAMLCFYGSSGRGTVAFCRSAVEEALADKNVPGSTLDKKIKNAPTSMLGDEEKTLANGARLTGRNAIHRMATVTDSQAILALTATTSLLNHIAQQAALPESSPDSDNDGS